MGAGVMKSGGGGNRRGRRRGRAQPMAEINVTPFVDVMLVLLVIFMVAAPLMTAAGVIPALISASLLSHKSWALVSWRARMP